MLKCVIADLTEIICCAKMSLLINHSVPILRPILAMSTTLARNPRLIPSDEFRLAHSYSSKPQQGSSSKDQEPPQLPKFSLDGLGATPAIKAVVYTMVGILGTVETYTYGLWIYHKLYPEAIGQNRPDGNKAEE